MSIFAYFQPQNHAYVGGRWSKNPKMCLRNIWMVPLIIIAWCCTSCRILSWHSWCGWSNWKTRKVIHFMLNFQFWCLISTGNHKLIVIIFSTFDWVVIRCEHCTFFWEKKVDIAGFCMLRNFMIVFILLISHFLYLSSAYYTAPKVFLKSVLKIHTFSSDSCTVVIS